jgi:Tfp pilus assembly protein PilP
MNNGVLLFAGCLIIWSGSVAQLIAAEEPLDVRSPFSTPRVITSNLSPNLSMDQSYREESHHELASEQNTIISQGHDYQLKGVMVKNGHRFAFIIGPSNSLRTLSIGDWLVREHLRIVAIGAEHIDIMVTSDTQGNQSSCSLNRVRLTLYPADYSKEE